MQCCANQRPTTISTNWDCVYERKRNIKYVIMSVANKNRNTVAFKTFDIEKPILRPQFDNIFPLHYPLCSQARSSFFAATLEPIPVFFIYLLCVNLASMEKKTRQFPPEMMIINNAIPFNVHYMAVAVAAAMKLNWIKIGTQWNQTTTRQFCDKKNIIFLCVAR